MRKPLFFNAANLFCTVLFLFSPLTFSQNATEMPKKLELNVQTAVDMALNYNLDLKMKQLDIKILQHTKETNWNAVIPSINAQTGINRSTNSSVFLPPANTNPTAELNKWTFSASIGASLSLSSSTVTSMLKTQRDFEAGVITFDYAVKKLQNDVKKAFYDILVSAEDARISGQTLIHTQKKYETDKSGYERGVVSELTMLRSQALYESAKSDVTTKVYMYNTALANFKNMLGISRETEVVFNGSIDPNLIELNADELILKHLYTRADIKTALLTLADLQATQRDSYISNFTPVLSAAYTVNYGDMFKPNAQMTDNGTVSFSLRLPLDSLIPGTKTNNAFFDRSVKIEQQKIKLQQTINNAVNDIYRMVMQLNSSAVAIKNFLFAEQIAERSYNVTYAAYQRGEVPYTNVTDAETSLETARQRVLSARYNYRTLLLDLELALNTVL